MDTYQLQASVGKEKFLFLAAWTQIPQSSLLMCEATLSSWVAKLIFRADYLGYLVAEPYSCKNVICRHKKTVFAALRKILAENKM